MKKLFFVAVAALSMLGFAACSNSQKSCDSCDKAADDKCCHGDVTEAYSGLLPAADAAGVRYTVVLDYDDDNHGTEGDFEMVQTYMVADTASASGLADKASFFSEGDFTRGNSATGDYIKLVSKTGDVTYFLVTSDSTLVLVGEALQPSDSGLNYTLQRAK